MDKYYETMCELRLSAGLDTNVELLKQLYFSIQTDKFEVLYNNLDKPIGYIAWADINQESLFRLEKASVFPKYFYEWKEGNIRLILDLVVLGGIKQYGFQNIKKLLKQSEKIAYIKNGKFIVKDLVEDFTKIDSLMTKSAPVFLQSKIHECGLASIAMIASYYGHELDMAKMRTRFPTYSKGMNLQNLIELGDSLGMQSRALQCPIDEVYKLQTPCILHWEMNHFVVLTKVSVEGSKQRFYINDPALGSCDYNFGEFNRSFDGICLELSPQ